MEKQSNCKKTSWVKGKCLGKGAFGTVSLAINQSNGDVFAVKSVDLATCHPNQLESLENEIRILSSLSSPYVVDYLGDDVTWSCRNLHMEYMQGGTVVDAEVIKQRLADVDESILRWHTRSLLLALKYVHDQGIVHCDVKGKNVLVGSDFTTVKLADFGSAIDRCSTVITPRGSPLWMAPEVIRCEYQGPDSDVWSLGCTVIEMVTGKPAWEDQGFNSLSRIANSDELPQVTARLSEVGRDFVEKCLRRDRNQRWSCDQLLQHPFVATASAPSKIGESSPRCVLDFGGSDFEEDESTEIFEASERERISKLATEGGVIWESDGWMAVRSYARESGMNCVEGISMEYPELISATQGIEGTILETADCCDGTDSLELQCSNYEVRKRIKRSSCTLRCGCCGCECLTGSSRPYGSQKVELAVENVELRINSFCNLLLQLILCNLIIINILLVFFNYYIYSLPFLLNLNFWSCNTIPTFLIPFCKFKLEGKSFYTLFGQSSQEYTLMKHSGKF